MPYPGQFHRLVIIGNMQNAQDTWNTTLSIVPSALGELGMPTVSPATLASVAGVVGTWYSAAFSTGCAFANSLSLTGIKLNRIGTDGRYADNETMEHVYGTPLIGSYSGTIQPQVTMVATLETALERGRASKGRMYLPPNMAAGLPAADGRTTSAYALGTANGVKSLINALNGVYTLIGRVGVASDAGAGRFEHVTGVRVGRVIDTMRSRRSSFSEDYEHVDL